MSNFPTYTPSGVIGIRAWLLFGPVGWFAALVLGWAYANALAVVTWKPAAIFVAMVLWITLILLVAVLANRSRSRSPRFNRWAGASIGFVALWAHWVVLLKIFGRPDLAAEFLGSGPIGWLRIVGDLASQRNGGGSGEIWLTFALWALEGALTIALPGSIAADAARDPYSESQATWAKPAFKGELLFPGGSSNSFAGLIAEHGTRMLLTMSPASAMVAESVAAEWWTVEVEGLAVDADPLARWLNVAMLIQTREGGHIKVIKQGVVKAWQVDAGAFDAVRERIHPADETIESAIGPPLPGRLESTPGLQQAVDALERNDFPSAFESAHGLVHCTDLRVRADALRLCALASSRMAQWDLAFDHFSTLFELEATAFNALQVASTSVCAGQLARGQAWLGKAHALNDQSREMQSPRIDTGFLSALEQAGEHAAALPLLDKLAVAYTTLPSLDDHFVWSHGLPFFGEFLRKSLPLLRSCLPEADVEAWYERMQAGLSSDGLARLEDHLADLRKSPHTPAH